MHILLSFKEYTFFLLSVCFFNQNLIAKSKESAPWYTNITSWALKIRSEPFYSEIPCNGGTPLYITNQKGSITIKTWSSPKIAIEATKTGTDQQLKDTTIDITTLPSEKVNIATRYKATSSACTVDYVLFIPKNCPVVATILEAGAIKIKNISSSLYAQTAYGGINMHNVSGSVKAHARDDIKISFELLTLAHIVDVKSDFGNITCTLPLEINADVTAKTVKGKISSEHYVTLKPLTVLLNEATWNHMKHEVYGAIGNGGTLINLQSLEGDIRLLKP